MAALKTLLRIAAVWLLVAGIALLTLWPHVPRSIADWIVLLVFGPPLYLLGEAFFAWLLGPDRKYTDAQRIGLLCGIIAVYVIGLVAWTAWHG